MRSKLLSALLIIAAGTSFIFAPMSAGAQFIYTVAGGGVVAGLGDGGLADSAQLYYPQGVAVDASGNIYIADSYHHRVRKVTTGTNIITTIAGTGTAGFGGDSGQATAAQLNKPVALALNAAGDIYIADYNNQRIRRVDATTGIITTIAGDSVAGYNGDSLLATASQLHFPMGLLTDSVGDLYIADAGNLRIRRIDVSTGIMTTVVGGGTNPGDSIVATAAEIFAPEGMAIGSGGTMYITDESTSRVKMIDPVSHIITTIAGTGHPGYTGDFGYAIAAELSGPYGLLVQDTTLYIADQHNNVIRALALPSGIITTYAGTDVPGYGGDGGYCDNAELYSPSALAQDGYGNIYIADLGNHRVRVISQNPLGVASIGAIKLSLYPNPSTGSFTLSTSAQYGTSYMISDMLGSAIRRGTITSSAQQIDIHGVAPGSYILSATGAHPQKFVVE